MKQKHFADYDEFVNDVVQQARLLDEYTGISIIAKYEEAQSIIKKLLCHRFKIGIIEIGCEEADGYRDEYVISITGSSSDAELWCEKMKREDKYLDVDAHVIYVMDNCSSRVIGHCISDIVYETNVGEDDSNHSDVEDKLYNVQTHNKYYIGDEWVGFDTWAGEHKKFAAVYRHRPSLFYMNWLKHYLF